MRSSVFLLPVLATAAATPAFAEPPRVVADIAPVHALLSQVMEGVATPELLLSQGDNPHAVQLKPSQAQMLADADLLVWVGPELSPWLDRIVDAEGGENLALIGLAETHLRDFGGGDAHEHDHGEEGHDHDEESHGEEGHEHGEGDHGEGDHDHADHGAEEGHGDADHAEGDEDHAHGAEEAGHDHEGHDAAGDDHAGEAGHDHEGHEEGHDGHEAHADGGHHHDHSGVDPHAWLSVENARAWVGVFADRLSTLDPDNAAAYRANAERAVAELDVLSAEIAGHLADHAGAEIVTFHEAFGYFADEFGVEVVGSVRPGDASAPSAAAIEALRGLVAEHGVECAFAEPAFDPGLLETIAGEAGIRVGTLDPTGALQSPGAGHYAATLGAIGSAIADCLNAG